MTVSAISVYGWSILCPMSASIIARWEVEEKKNENLLQWHLLCLTYTGVCCGGLNEDEDKSCVLCVCVCQCALMNAWCVSTEGLCRSTSVVKELNPQGKLLINIHDVTDALCISMDHFSCTLKSYLNNYDAIRKTECVCVCVWCIKAFYLEDTMRNFSCVGLSGVECMHGRVVVCVVFLRERRSEGVNVCVSRSWLVNSDYFMACKAVRE